MRFVSGFIAGASCGMVAGAFIGALLAATAIEAIGRAVVLPRPGKVEVEDLIDAWASDR
jgi:hypothetical protein